MKEYFKRLGIIIRYLKKNMDRLEKGKYDKEPKMFILFTWLLLFNYMLKGPFKRQFMVSLPGEKMTDHYGSLVKVPNSWEHIFELVVSVCGFEVTDEFLTSKKTKYKVALK